MNHFPGNERWKCTCFHCPPFFCHTRVSSTVRTVGDPSAPALGYGRIAHFYFPLLLTSVIGLMVHPMLTFFMGRAPAPVP